MIAKLKVAQVEHWCQEGNAQVAPHWYAIVGMMVEIHTEQMKKVVDICNGRRWLLTRESAVAVNTRAGFVGRKDIPTWICEHMLEMD